MFTRLSDLKGVSPNTQKQLSRLGIHTLEDLLFHLPIRYENRTQIKPLSQCPTKEPVLTQGRIEKTWETLGQRRSLLCNIIDGSQRLTLRFFHYQPKQKQQLSCVGLIIRCFGTIRCSSFGLEMVHPQYTVMHHHTKPLEQTLTPVYPLTEGLTQTALRKLVSQALLVLDTPMMADFPPPSLKAHHGLALKEALLSLHKPSAHLAEHTEKIALAKKRLALDELLAYQLRLLQLREQVKQCSGIRFKIHSSTYQAFLKQLPFTLTTAQQRVMREIEHDLSMGKPMLRLLQGDVGSGKTVIAMMSLLYAIDNGYQAVLMAPTEILARQHYQQCQQWLKPMGVHIGFLVSNIKNSDYRALYKQIKRGEIQAIIGTHALFQDHLHYKNLALVIIDEQHRFGVHQRLALRTKAQDQSLPHQLVMTATPIPRTLAMTAYADLDYSVIDQLPQGRKPISTILLSNTQRGLLIQRLKHYCQKGRQVYWVCTLIETSDILQCQAAEAVASELQEKLEQQHIGLVHGRMSAEERHQVMHHFQAEKINILVATTVVEVGVDVPNASVMVIENAERLGLAQLHQLRGRVGRGVEQSYCVLLHKSQLSKEAEKRLSIIRQTQDGFVLAKEDMQMRGAGEILGKRQAGLALFKIADIQQDAELVPKARQLALMLHQQNNKAHALIKRWHFDQNAELLSS